MSKFDLELRNNPTKKHKGKELKSLNKTLNCEEIKSEDEDDNQQNHYLEPERPTLDSLSDDQCLEVAEDTHFDDEDCKMIQVERIRDEQEQKWEIHRIILMNCIRQRFLDAKDINAYTLTCSDMYTLSPGAWECWWNVLSPAYKNKLIYNACNKSRNLVNYGNTCFISVVMHSVHYITQICSSFKIQNKNIQRIMNFLDGQDDASSQRALIDFIMELRRIRTPDNFGNGGQADADEFFGWLIRFMFPQCFIVPHVVPGIGGISSMHKQCTNCGHVSNTRQETFHELHVGIRGRGLSARNADVQSVINTHLKVEKQKDLSTCDHCQAESKFIYSTRINQIDEMLLITFKRNEGNGAKNNKWIDINATITVPVWDYDEDCMEEIELDCCGFISHRGLHAKTGHYNCSFICSVNKKKQPVFRLFDDMYPSNETFTLNEMSEIKKNGFTPYIMVYKKRNHELHQAVKLIEAMKANDGKSEKKTKALNYVEGKSVNIASKSLYEETDDATVEEVSANGLASTCDGDVKPQRPPIPMYNEDKDEDDKDDAQEHNDSENALSVVSSSSFDIDDSSLPPVGVKYMAICAETGMIAVVDQRHIHIFSANHKPILSHYHVLGFSHQVVVIAKWYRRYLYVLHSGRNAIYKFKYNASQQKLELNAILSDEDGGYAIIDFVHCDWHLVTIHEQRIMCVYIEVAADLKYQGYFVCKEMIEYGLDDSVNTVNRCGKPQIMIRQKSSELTIELQFGDPKLIRPIYYSSVCSTTFADDYIPTLTTSSTVFGSLGCIAGNKMIQSWNNAKKCILDIDSYANLHFKANVENVLYINWIEQYGINGALALCVRLDTNVFVWLKLIDAATWNIVNELIINVVGMDIFNEMLSFIGCQRV